MTLPTFAIHTINLRVAYIASKHPEITPPPYTAPVNPTHPFIEIPHTLFWGPGASMTTTKTLFDGYTPAQLGHDSGIGIIHIGLPPGPLTPLAIATSSFKCVWAAGSVLSENKPTAGHLPPIINMLQCQSPVPLPIGMVLLFKNTVFVGMTLADLLAGVLRVVIAIVLAKIFNKLGDPNSKGRFAQMWQKIGARGEIFGNSGFWSVLGNKVLSTALEDLAKTPLNIIMEGKIALPYQIAELDLTNGQFKVFYWNVGGSHYQVKNHSVQGVLEAMEKLDKPSASNPLHQATEGIPTIGE